MQPFAVAQPRAVRVPDDAHIGATQPHARRDKPRQQRERRNLEVRRVSAQADEAREDEIIEGRMEVVRATVA